MADSNRRERTATLRKKVVKKIKTALDPDYPEQPARSLDQTPASYNPAIDYPREGEEISGESYTIRIVAEPGSDVEVSINNGDWQPAREAVGYWWYDWQPLGQTRCKLVARSRVGGDPWKESKERSCVIASEQQPMNVGLTLN